MYTAILAVPRGYRADTDTAVHTMQTLGSFHTVQAAETAA